MSPKMIKKVFINSIKNDGALKEKLANACHCKISTIERWLRESDIMLTTIGNIPIIKNHFGLSQDTEILEEVKKVKAIK